MNRLSEDSGVTLVELIMYVFISALFVGLLATLFATNLKSGEETGNRDMATGTSQVVAETLQTSVRNAAAIKVDGSLLRAQVAKGASQWECRAWALEAGELRYTTSTSAIPAGSTAGWTTLAKGVAGTKTGGSPFLLTAANSISIGYTVTVGDATVKITSAVTTQAKAEGTVPPCW